MWKKILPIAVVLVLGWIGLNLITGDDDDDDTVAAVSEEATDTASAAADEATDAAEDAADAAEDAAEDAADAAEDAADTASAAADAATDAAEDAADTASAAADAATDAAEDAADTASAATDAATDAAEDAAEDAADSASAAADAATDAAEDAAGSASAAADAATDAAEDAADTASAAVAATTAAVAATAVAAADTTDSTSEATASSTDTANATDTQTADAADGNVEMRYPTDPVTGATIFDQGMVEVVIEPTNYDAPPPMPVAPPAPQPIAPPPAPTETRDYPTVEGPRFPTDPVTGATIYDQVMIMPDGTEVPVEVTTAATSESGDADSTAQTEVAAVTDTGTDTGNRLPVDPVTGATIYPETAGAETAAQTTTDSETTSETASAETATETSSDSTAQASNRLPVDPVTGATIYPESAGAETAAQTTTESETTSAETATESSSSDSTTEASNRLPVDPVTGATIFPEQADTTGDTEIQTAVAVQTESVESTSSTSSTSSTTTRTVVNLGGLSRQLGNVFGTTTVALEQAVDEESARAALPILESASENLTSVAEQISALPETARNPVNRVISNGMSRLKPLVDTAMTRDGVGAVLSEVVTPMMETMDSMSE